LLSGSLLAWVTLFKKNGFANVTHKLDYWLSHIIFSEKQEADSKTLSNVLSFVGLLLLVYGFWRINKELSFPGKWALVPVLGAVLIITAGSKAWVNRTILSNKIAVWFGLISFPLYLWHWPILSFARIVEGEIPSRNIRIVAVVLSILLAWLTYKLIERPLRFGKNSKAKVAVLVVLMVVIGGFSYYSYRKILIPSRAVKASSALKQLGWNIPAGSPEQSNLCRQAFPERALMTSKERDDNFCLLQRKGIPNVVLIGDSINLSLFPGLAKYNDYNVLVLSASTAAPFFNVRTTDHDD
jgi:peptidoglycan/LPS O-acetylase OafA/YrhL